MTAHRAHKNSTDHTPCARPKRLAVLLSGGGRTLANLQHCIDAHELDASIKLVIASRQCPGVQRARMLGLHTRVLPGDIPRDTLVQLLAEQEIDWIILAGYARLLPIPPGYENRVVNIHPSLLPNFGGPGMHGMRVHEAALAAGVKVSGCTVHLCDNEYDTGPIVLQRVCPVLEGDTAETLAQRVFELEKEAYPAALSMLFSGQVAVDGPNVRMIKG